MFLFFFARITLLSRPIAIHFFAVQKTLIIRNSGKRLMPFSVIYDTSRRGNYFDYDYERGRLLAPGLTATLTVTFNCTTMEDTYDLINIIAKDNQTIDIVVSAENAIPILNCKTF